MGGEAFDLPAHSFATERKVFGGPPRLTGPAGGLPWNRLPEPVPGDERGSF
jgi:hypothetical protein